MGEVVVTGAASGIGRASAEALIADGRQVVLWDVAPEVVEVAGALGARGEAVDVTDMAAVTEALVNVGDVSGLVHAMLPGLEAAAQAGWVDLRRSAPPWHS